MESSVPEMIGHQKEIATQERMKTILQTHIQPNRDAKNLGYIGKTIKPPLTSLFGSLDTLYQVQQLSEVPQYDHPHIPRALQKKYLFEENEINRNLWEELFILSPRLAEVAFAERNTATPRHMLAALSLVADEQVFLEDRLDTARKLLQRYFPFLVPQEQTILVAEYCSRDTEPSSHHTGEASNGYFWGKYDKHYIVLEIVTEGNINKNGIPINPEMNPYKQKKSEDKKRQDLKEIDVHHGGKIGKLIKLQPSQDETRSNLVTVHELIHQSVHEEVNRQRNAHETNSVADDTELLSPNEIVRKKHPSHPLTNPNTLAGVIDEGFATYYSLNIGENNLYRVFRTEGNPGFHEWNKVRSEQLESMDIEKGLSSGYPLEETIVDNPHGYGYKLIEKMRKIPQFAESIKNGDISFIDLKKCEQVVEGTKEFDVVLNNPALIPQLKESEKAA